MEWSHVWMIVVLLLAASVALLVAYGLGEAKKQNDHKRKLELMREQRNLPAMHMPPGGRQ
jgi:hypothetical protein